MICPNCGEELKPGKLMCEKCGAEVKIVPEFDPEIENSIEKILNDVADEVHGEKKLNESSEDLDDLLEDEGSKKRFSIDSRYHTSLKIMGIMGLAFILMILGFAAFWMIVSYRLNNYDYQMKRAANFVAEGNLNEAANSYRHILTLRNNDPLATYNLANVNLALEDTESALLLYKEIVASDNAEADIRYNACSQVIDIYVSQENYQAISDFLVTIGDDEISNYFNNYKCKVPDFSYNEGTYDIVVPLKLTAVSSGNIYYSLEGDERTDGFVVYNTPIFLEGGEYIVSAYFENSFGVKSETVTKIYHIEVSDPLAPEVLTYSGDYDEPTLIEVEVPEEAHVYYTSNGTDPDSTCTEYTYPIHMPIGKSEFRFISYNKDGVSGEVITRNYNLELDSRISVAEAEALIVDGLLGVGKIYTPDGLSGELYGGRFLYQYQYTTSINNAGNFYIIAEIMEDEAGVKSRTGTLYAVNILDCKRYRLSLDERNNYVFYEF